MYELAKTASPQAIARVGKDALELLFGAQGVAPKADVFAEALRLASAQVHPLAQSRSRSASLARLAALCRIAPGIVDFLPASVPAQIGPVGPSRPHILNETASRREAVVHAVLLLELRGGLEVSESSINRNLWKIERIAADFLTGQFRAAGGSDKIRVSPEPVTGKTIQTWVRRFENDPVWGLYNRPPRQRRSVGRDLVERPYASPADIAPTSTPRHGRPSNVVLLQPRGKGRNPTFVPWWLKDFS
jgi:hypothetical protein